MRQCDDETRHSLTPPPVCTFVNFIDTNKLAFTPPADRKIVPCLGKICALPRKIFFLLIPAKAPSPPLSQKHKNIFTSNITLTPATCKGTHIFRLEYSLLILLGFVANSLRIICSNFLCFSTYFITTLIAFSPIST